jgi:hypothetical protein
MSVGPPKWRTMLHQTAPFVDTKEVEEENTSSTKVEAVRKTK